MRRRWGCWIGVLGCLLLLPIMIQSVLRMMLYPVPQVPVDATPAVEEVLLPNLGHVVGWWANTELPAEAPVVIYFHGNGENLQTLLWSGLFERTAQAGGRLLAIDYPGYGNSSGRPSQRSLTAAGVAAVEAAQNRFPDSPLIVVGWSLGAAVAAQVAAQVAEPADLAAVVLLSPWRDLRAVATVHYPSWLVNLAIRDRYDSAAALRGAAMPIVIVHGEQDGLIPFTQGQQLAASLSGNAGKADKVGKVDFIAVPGASHNDLMGAEQTWQVLTTLLAAQASKPPKTAVEGTAEAVGESPR